MISYEGLWRLLQQKGISQYELTAYYHISASRLYSMRHNKYVRTDTIDRLCRILKCKPEDLIEVIPAKKHELSETLPPAEKAADSPDGTY